MHGMICIRASLDEIALFSIGLGVSGCIMHGVLVDESPAQWKDIVSSSNPFAHLCVVIRLSLIEHTCRASTIS